MKTVLICLPQPHLARPYAQVPLGILYLAAILERRGNPVGVKNYSGWGVDESIRDLPEADHYGLSISSMQLPFANTFAARIIEKYPGSEVWLGGPGTITPDLVNWRYVSRICIGEGEHAILDMMSDSERGRPKRVYHGTPVVSLDTLPLPARHLVSHQGGDVFAYRHNFKEGGSVTILSSRGCPHRCSFCASSVAPMPRMRSPAHVRLEIQHVIETYGVRQFRFGDDLFTSSKKRVFAMCDAIGDLGVVWRVSARVKPLDKEMIRVMYEAGCREMSFGMESFDDHVLAVLRKGATVAENIRAIDLCKDSGIIGRCLLMIRTPGQRRETVGLNKYWLTNIKPDIVACTSFVPLPGSDIWDNPGRYNIEILDRDLSHYNFHFWGPDGENPLRPIIRPLDRNLDEFQEESQEFREWLMETGTLNKG